MNSNGVLRKHWIHVWLHSLTDAGLFCLSYWLGMVLRFGEESSHVLGRDWLFAVISGLGCAAVTYIFSLYSIHSGNQGIFKRALVLLFSVGLASAMLVALTYLSFVLPLGRGAVLLGATLSYLLILIHHVFLLHALRHTKERVAYIVTCPFDEVETRLFSTFGVQHLELIGLVEYNGYRARGEAPVLGKAVDLAEIVKKHRINRILCTDRSLRDQALCRHFCQLRYSGVSVMPLINLFEEIYQYVPLELVSSEWLLGASGEPHLLYIRKSKRLLDVVVSVLLLTLCSPLLLLAILAIKLTSPGPILYRQVRSGRFGRPFTVLKLRTMRVDAEKNGAVWSGGANDPRVTWIGRFLRRYRIDEIPQLIHVLTGDMSFVGPRPERPEMIETLAREVPHYQERLMVQPGLTGWAQVSYPYGASVEDSRRKLEYDLYYMKHMSFFLDLFILLDTVRIVLCGGVHEREKAVNTRQEAMREWQRAKEVDGVSAVRALDAA